MKERPFKKKSLPTQISVRGDTHSLLKEIAENRGEFVGKFVGRLINEELDREGFPRSDK